MAHHKSAKKRILVSAKKNKLNKSSVSKIKTLVKKAFATDSPENAEKNYKEAVSYLDKMADKGRIHKNNAARKKRQLTLHLNKISSSNK